MKKINTNPIKVGAIGLGYKKNLKEAGIVGTLVTDIKDKGCYKFERADSKRVIKIRYFKPITIPIPILGPAVEPIPSLPDLLTLKESSEPDLKKTNPSRIRMIFIRDLIQEGTHTKAEICHEIQMIWPEIKQSTLDTILSDGQNVKYNKFPQLVVVTKTEKGKIYSFRKED